MLQEADLILCVSLSNRLKKARCNGFISTSIAIEQSRGGAVQLEALPVSDEHGHHGPILALGKDLLGLEVLGGGVAPLQLSPPEQGRLLPRSLCVQPAFSDWVVDRMIG